VTAVVPPPSSVGKLQTLRRAQAIALLRNPNLVRMLPLPGGAGLVPVLTDARSLAEFTFPSGTFRRFDLEQVVRLLLDVLAGLSALHDVVVDGEPFVHGEVSPKNIYIGEHGTAKLLPLTSSHLASAPKLEATGYLAPELLVGHRGDARADLFSVGVMLCEALAGERLFPEPEDGASIVGVQAAQRERRPLTRARVAWAQPLCAIAERASASDPGARYGSAVELSNAIAEAVGRHLAKVNADTWQDEAPTPVFQPRLHLPAPRSATPPATVIDVPRAAAPRDEEPDVADEPTATAKRPPRYRALALGLTSLVIVAALGGAFGQSFDYRALRRGVTLPSQAPAAAALLPRVTAPLATPPPPPPPPLDAAPAPAAPAPAAPAPAASASAMPATAASVAPVPAAKPRVKPVARPRTKVGLRPDRADYGI
jgi:hypothetical protein